MKTSPELELALELDSYFTPTRLANIYREEIFVSASQPLVELFVVLATITEVLGVCDFSMILEVSKPLIDFTEDEAFDHYRAKCVTRLTGLCEFYLESGQPLELVAIKVEAELNRLISLRAAPTEPGRKNQEP